MEQQNGEKFVNLLNEIGNKMSEMNGENVEMKKQIELLLEENRKMKEKIAKMEKYMKELKSSIGRQPMPIELLNELFGSMPLENGFSFLVKMSNGLLARNVQKMIKGIKETMKNNKLNAKDCGQSLTFSEDGLILKHFGPNCIKSVRAVLPIPKLNLKGFNKSTIAFYYEVQIRKKAEYWNDGIVIGFSDEHFPLEDRWIRRDENSNSISIGTFSKKGIWIDGLRKEFENQIEYFKMEKVIVLGLGIIHQPNLGMECFGTVNGEFLGKMELPSKFINFQLFPAVNIYDADDSIRVKFRKEEWNFNEFGQALK